MPECHSWFWFWPWTCHVGPDPRVSVTVVVLSIHLNFRQLLPGVEFTNLVWELRLPAQCIGGRMYPKN